MKIAEEITRGELDALLKVSTALTGSLELSDVLQTAIDCAVDVLSLDTGAIYLLEGKSLILGATTPALPTDFPEKFRRAPLCEHPHIEGCLSSGETVCIPDYATADLTPEERGVGEIRRLKSVFYVPLAAEGDPVGVFIVGTSEKMREFSSTDKGMCRTLSHQVTLAITNARLYESVRTAYSRLEEAQESLLKNNELLGRMNEEMKRANEVKDRFLALMSHELRTPLTVINSYLGFILDRGFGNPSEELREVTMIMKDQVRNQLGLIEDLMNLTSLESGHIKIFRELCDPGKLMSEVIKVFRPVQVEKDITVSLDLAPHLPTVYWDNPKMTQVFQNLLGNALKFTSPGGRVTISIRLKGDFVEIRVSDSGIGIPEESVRQVFDRFYQVDSSPTRQYGGSGLGLTFVREIVQAHNGKVLVESEEGVGSTFLVLVPPGEMEREGIQAEFAGTDPVRAPGS